MRMGLHVERSFSQNCLNFVRVKTDATHTQSVRSSVGTNVFLSGFTLCWEWVKFWRITYLFLMLYGCATSQVVYLFRTRIRTLYYICFLLKCMILFDWEKNALFERFHHWIILVDTLSLSLDFQIYKIVSFWCMVLHRCLFMLLVPVGRVDYLFAWLVSQQNHYETIFVLLSVLFC